MPRPTAHRPASWLPREHTTFIGRAAELDRLAVMLKEARLVTVTGTGGVGKTRLALRAAAAAESSFPDGVRLTELSGLRDPELLPNTIAAVLELPEHDPRPRLEQVLDYLHDAGLLLILDTCEHLVEACALFAEAVLTRTENVTILATSREPLFVAGEHEYALSPLTVGAGAPDGDAVELFAQRAAAAAPGLSSCDDSRAAMARLCRHLDGIPLAIELAAVQLREVSLAELTRRMERRFLDLPGSRPDSAGRHHTLRRSVDWSYDLCTPAEKVLWDRLSVFAGPATADAITQVCAGPGLPAGAVMDTLIGLADKSVITRTGDVVSRYRVLDTIREYGAERLSASGAQPRVRARHLRRYLGLANELAARPLRDQVRTHRALREEHNDIRAALEYANTVPDAPGRMHPAVQLPAKLAWFWAISGLNAEARYWLTRGLEHAPAPGPERAAALIARGYSTAYLGNVSDGLADSDAAISIADDLGDRRLGARARAHLAYIQLSANQLEEAKRTAAAAGKQLGHDVGDEDADLPVMLGTVQAYLSLLTGDPEGSLDVCELTLRLIPGDAGERWGSGYLYGIVGFALCLLGQADEGNRAALRALALKQELGDAAGLAHCLGAAALVAGAQKRHERAAWLTGAADTLWDKFGSVFIGVDVMQEFAGQAAADARAALGDTRYDALVRDGASRHLDQVIDVAVQDADRLPALPPGGPEADGPPKRGLSPYSHSPMT
ncbi:MAG: LuxR family transcriptional regulator [Streptosporangiales bacterium]|nr:LuxR family transcriptional regulator [Streptosporangiales bacterium]